MTVKLKQEQLPIPRRELLRLALASPIVAAVSRITTGYSQKPRGNSLAGFPGYVVALDGSTLTQVELTRRWRDSLCHSQIVNRGAAPIRIKEVVLFDLPLA